MTQWLEKVDHITYVVYPHTIRKWAWLYIDHMGGQLVLRVDDTNPDDSSSMMLWCIDFSAFGIALVAGIDRSDKSHITGFADRHGDHSVQHIAYQVPNLEQFCAQMQQLNGLKVIGPAHERHDGFGFVRQVFAKGYTADMNSAEVGFPEFVERPQNRDQPFPDVSFSAKVGMNLYTQAQQAMVEDEREAAFDFGAMPVDWDPGQVQRSYP